MRNLSTMNVELRGQCMRRGSPSWNKRVPMSKRKTVKWRKRPPSIDNAYPAASRALKVHCTHVPMAEDRRQIPVAGQRGEGWRHFCNSIWVPPTIDSTCRSNLVSITASRLIRTTVVCSLPAKFPAICYRNVQKGQHKGGEMYEAFYSPAPPRPDLEPNRVARRSSDLASFIADSTAEKTKGKMQLQSFIKLFGQASVIRTLCEFLGLCAPCRYWDSTSPGVRGSVILIHPLHERHLTMC